jgi:hypothetical protein
MAPLCTPLFFDWTISLKQKRIIFSASKNTAIVYEVATNRLVPLLSLDPPLFLLDRKRFVRQDYILFKEENCITICNVHNFLKVWWPNATHFCIYFS